MHAQTKYKSEMKTAVLGDRTITIKNRVFRKNGGF